MIDDVVGFVDVQDGAIPQAAHRGIVFFVGDVVVRFIQQFEGAMESTGAIQSADARSSSCHPKSQLA